MKIGVEQVCQPHWQCMIWDWLTIIGPIYKDASGKPLSASMKSTIERLRTWDSRASA